MSQNCQVIAALQISDLEVEGRLTGIFDRFSWHTPPMRIVLEKLSGTRVRPVDELIDGRHIATCLNLCAAMDAAQMEPERIGVGGAATCVCSSRIMTFDS